MRLLTAICEFLAAWFGWRTSPAAERAEKRKRQIETDRTVQDVAEAVRKGDEDRVNAHIQTLLRVVVLWAVLGLCAGCVGTTKVVYVPETDRAIRMEHAGRPGWWLPDAVMARLLEDATRWQYRERD